MKRKKNPPVSGSHAKKGKVAVLCSQEVELEHLATFPRLNPNPVMELDERGFVTYFNDAVSTVLREMGCPDDPSLLLPPDMQQVIHELGQSRKRTVVRDVRIKNRVFTESIFIPVPMKGIRIYAAEITERIRVEEALRESREREQDRSAELGRLLDAVPAAVWISHDSGGMRITGNRLSDEWLQVAPGTNVSKSAPEGERPETYRVFRDGVEVPPEELPVQQASGGREIRDYEFDFVYPDGSTRHVAGNASPLFDNDGNPRGAVAAFIDVTARQRTEEELRATRDYLEALFNYANAPIIVWDPEFRITRFNKAFEALTGRRAQDVIGRPLEILFPKETTADAYALLRRTQTGERWETVEIPILRVDGSVRTVLWNSATLFGEDGKAVTATIAQGQDITERARAEQERGEYLSILEFVTDTATDFLTKTRPEEVFEYTAQKISELAGNGFVLVNSYEPADNCTVVRAFGGNRSILRAVSANLGRELIGLRLAVDAGARQRMNPGSLSKVEGGVYGLAFGQLPESLCRQVEGELGLGDIFAMPMVSEEELLGIVAVLTRGKVPGRNARVIETIVNQASIALKRLRVEESLRQRDHEYRMLMEEASDGIVLISRDGRFVVANSKACELFGYTSEELLSFRVRDLMPREDVAQVSEWFGDFEAGRRLIIEHGVIRKDGTHRFVETSARRLADGRFQAIFHDVTDRKMAEEEFTHAVKTQVFDRLILALREFQHGEGLVMNLHRLALFGKNFRMLFGGAGDQEAQDQMEPSARTRLEIAVREYVTICHERLREIASLLRAVESEISQAEFQGEQPVSANEIFRRSDLLKGDLEELLRAVTGEGAMTPDARIASGERIADHVQALLASVDALTSQLNTHYTSDISEVIGTVVPTLQSASGEARIVVEEMSHSLKAIIGPADLAEILLILLTNSLEAPLREGVTEKRIVVRTRAEETRVRIEVEDNGEGVKEEVRGNLFAPGVTTKGSGHGHGLSYAQKHLRKYGGTLIFDEQFRGGTLFAVELALA